MPSGLTIPPKHKLIKVLMSTINHTHLNRTTGREYRVGVSLYKFDVIDQYSTTDGQ